jgi:hypothetical protein
MQSAIAATSIDWIPPLQALRPVDLESVIAGFENAIP